MCYYKQLRREYLLSRMKENRKFKNNILRRNQMENTLTEEQIQDIENALQKVIEVCEKICKSIIEIGKQLWINLKQFVLRSEKAIKYIRIYNRTHSNRIKKKQITKIVKLFENYKK